MSLQDKKSSQHSKEAANSSNSAEQLDLSESELKTMFLSALRELKYMGLLSQTRQSTFIFKKNYFGKCKHLKQIVKTNAQLEQEQRAVQRQFGAQYNQQ